jgi:hypothetical protein
MTDEHREKTINDSGFPLQLGLEELAHGVPNWAVILSEHAWTDPLSSEPKFVDFVMRDKSGHQSLVVECKRARDTEWLFLRKPPESEHSNARTAVRARMTVRPAGSGRVFDGWQDVQYQPGSPEATHCAVRKPREGRGENHLESAAAQIVRATDALAEQEVIIFDRERRTKKGFNTAVGHVYVPVIVTRARLFICDADLAKVDLDKGEAPCPSIRPVPVIRFRKSLGSTDSRRSGAWTIEQFAEESLRTVMVVQASAMQQFLSNWEISRSQFPSSLLCEILGIA